MLKILAKAQTLIWDPKYIIKELKEDTQGATMIEYSLLIGLITIAMIASLVIVANWIVTKWGLLEAAVVANP